MLREQYLLVLVIHNEIRNKHLKKKVSLLKVLLLLNYGDVARVSHDLVSLERFIRQHVLILVDVNLNEPP